MGGGCLMVTLESGSPRFISGAHTCPLNCGDAPAEGPSFPGVVDS